MGDKPESLAPALQANYDRARQLSSNRLSSSYNQNIPQDARLAMQQQQDRDLTADYSTALNQSAYNAYDANLARRLALANMTIGKPVVTQQKGYGSQVGNSVFGDLLQGAAQVGGAALGAAAG